MTIKEIKELRVQQEQIRQDNYKANEKLCIELQQSLKQLDELEQKAHDDLVKKIAKHFKGIKPYIILSNTELVIGFNDVSNFAYRYGQFSWNNITSKLAHTIKAEYEEVYGEPKEQAYAPYIQTTGLNQFSGCITDFNGYIK